MKALRRLKSLLRERVAKTVPVAVKSQAKARPAMLNQASRRLAAVLMANQALNPPAQGVCPT